MNTAAGSATLARPGLRVRLEPLCDAHAPGIGSILRDDPDAWRFMLSSPPADGAGVLAWVRKAAAARERGEEEPYAAVEAGSGRVIGSTRLLDILPEHRSAEIGWTFYERASRRTGVNTACKLLLLERAFDGLGCERVQLICDARNEASRAAIARLGASFEGVLRRHLRREDGAFRDSAFYGIVRREWPAVRVRLGALLAGR